MYDMEEYNAQRQTAKVLEGMKGPAVFNAKPNLAPKMTFKDGYPESVSKSLQHREAERIPTLDPWVVRRSGTK